MEERPIEALKAAPISQNEKITREIPQNSKSCSKRKNLLEIREVAKKLPSNLWKALSKVEGLQPDLHSYGAFADSKPNPRFPSKASA